ncbi:response regulator transcription factor [Frankia gtarii]|uniref:response regulator transcription factor n=1 Tax=Frankia gtarii TaxID=2950102 RepID=UPI0021C23A6E|nr:response regulator transcription factor [Frankia gtarii]
MATEVVTSASASVAAVVLPPDVSEAGSDAPEQIRLLIFCEETAPRLGLALVLSRESWVERCLTASDLQQALAHVRASRPAVVVLELSTFVAPHVDALRQVDPGIRVVLSSHCGLSTEIAVRRLGAVGALNPDMGAAEVAKIVRAVAFDERITVNSHRHGKELGLTDRELQVMAFLTMGATNLEIAAQMHLSRASIKKHAASIYRKLGVRNRTELARVMAERAPARALLVDQGTRFDEAASSS